MSEKSDMPAKYKNPPSKTKRRLAKSLLRRGADSSLPEIIFISTFILIRWWNNSDFSYFGEIFLPIALFSILASVVFYLYRWIIGAGIGAHVAALSLTYFFYIFQFVEGTRFGKFIEELPPGNVSTPFSRSLVLATALAVVCGSAGWAAAKLYDRYELPRKLQLYKVLLFTILFIFSLQVMRTAGRLLELRQQLSYDYPAPALEAAPSSAISKPDIFYFVFDRYTGAEVLADNFNYDNSDLIAYLNDHGFETRPQAYSNYPFTMSSIASTMAMDYLPEFEEKFGGDGSWQSAHPYRSILKKPPIASVLKANGYQYNQISSWWDFTRVGVKADYDPAKSFRLRIAKKSFFLSDLQRDIFFKSVLSPWLKKGISVRSTALVKYDLDRNPRENFEAQFESVLKIAQRQDRTTPQFSFAHVLAPHPPYVFDADGGFPAYDGESNDNGVDERRKYTNSLQYLNTRLKVLISELQKADPQAVVVIQADEGPYPKQFRGRLSPKNYYEPSKLPQKDMKQKFSILASYRLPNTNREKTAGIGSSVNAFRVILNEYLGYNLPLLPDCQLSMGNKFNIYDYSLVNNKLGKSSPDECKKYE